MPSDAWLPLFTRWGEGQILLPLMWITAVAMAVQPGGRRPALLWLAGTAVAVAVVLGTKVAFFGFGWGYAPWRYTGFSGHAMFACAAWPVWAVLAVATWRPGDARAVGLAALLGLAAALGVGASRLALGAHSLADVVLGSLAGVAASGPVVWLMARRPATAAAQSLWPDAGARRRVLAGVMLGVGLALIGLPQVAPPARTHGWVLQWSTALSGRATPYSLQELTRRSP